MATKHFDVAIIGGGIIGCATAYWISKRFNAKTILLECESQLATHQTGKNSGVIHSGVYYSPESQKAILCTTGRELMYQFCRDHDIEFKRCGKIIVATNPAQEDRLNQLLHSGTSNGLKDLAILNRDGIKKIEPNAGGIAALHIPDAGIVNFAAVTKQLADLAANNGCEIRLSSKLVDFEIDSKQDLILATSTGILQTRNLINCAGLQSDRIAKICGADIDVRIIPFRGEYYSVSPNQNDLIKALIYPVPDPNLPFLGVHLTKKLDGSIEIGPNALFASGRNAYNGFRLGDLPDLLTSLTYSGFWKLSYRHWKTGAIELYRSFNTSAMLREVQNLIPAIQRHHIKKTHSGIRAQAVSRKGELINDFIIERGHNSIHVLNAPSPAATASLAIGNQIAEMAEEIFELDVRK